MAASKEELISGFADARAQLQGLMQALSDQDWQKGVYQDGWNAKQILAHVAGQDNVATIDRLIGQAKGQAAPPSRPAGMTGDEYNQMRVNAIIGKSAAELAADFDGSCAKAIAKLEAIPQEDLDIAITTGFGAGGTVGDLVRRIGSGHLVSHIGDIQRAVRPVA